MTENEKCELGLLYNTSLPDRELDHLRCADLCFDYNHTRPSDMKRREEILRRLFGRVGKNVYVEPNFFCGFGHNIEAGDNFYINNNCVMVDPAKIIFGDNVLIAPNCSFYTAGHPLDAKRRGEYLEYAYPICVGDNVWFGGNCVVLPGVTIGSNVVIGAGSVVKNDIPSGVLAFGNPCKVHRPITEKDMETLEFGGFHNTRAAGGFKGGTD